MSEMFKKKDPEQVDNVRDLDKIKPLIVGSIAVAVNEVARLTGRPAAEIARCAILSGIQHGFAISTHEIAPSETPEALITAARKAMEEGLSAAPAEGEKKPEKAAAPVKKVQKEKPAALPMPPLKTVSAKRKGQQAH